jgi:site-specific recombinase XerC
LQQIRPGVWKVSIATPTGRQSRTVHGTRADADGALAKLHDDVVGPAASLNALAARFLAHTEESGRTPHTVRRYRQLWRDWLAPSLASTHPNVLHPAQVEATLAATANAGQSASSVRQAATVISSLCRWAQDTGLANYNPALAARLPDGHRITTRRR